MGQRLKIISLVIVLRNRIELTNDAHCLCSGSHHGGSPDTESKKVCQIFREYEGGSLRSASDEMPSSIKHKTTQLLYYCICNSHHADSYQIRSS